MQERYQMSSTCESIEEWKNVIYAFDSKLCSEFETVLVEEAERYADFFDKESNDVYQSLIERDMEFICKVLYISTRKRKRNFTPHNIAQVIHSICCFHDEM